MRSRTSPARPVVDQLLAEKEPLCEAEQEQLIQEFEVLHIQQSRMFRLLYGGFAALLGLFFCWASFEQHVRPYTQRYTGEFRTVTGDGAAVAAVLLVQGLALGCAAGGLLTGRPSKNAGTRGCLPGGVAQRMALLLALVGALVGAAFWGAAMYKMVAQYGEQLGARWSLLWLPLGPLVFCGLCWYIAVGLDRSGADVQRMRRLKYAFKKV